MSNSTPAPQRFQFVTFRAGHIQVLLPWAMFLRASADMKENTVVLVFSDCNVQIQTKQPDELLKAIDQGKLASVVETGLAVESLKYGGYTADKIILPSNDEEED